MNSSGSYRKPRWAIKADARRPCVALDTHAAGPALRVHVRLRVKTWLRPSDTFHRYWQRNAPLL
eukprot:55466-Alexandrium_andersonii.AAC.1